MRVWKALEEFGAPMEALAISREVLIQNKKATGRLKDLADVETLEDQP